MSALKIAVAGAGLIGRAHIARIGQSRQCELAAIADHAAMELRRRARLERAATPDAA